MKIVSHAYTGCDVVSTFRGREEEKRGTHFDRLLRSEVRGGNVLTDRVQQLMYMMLSFPCLLASRARDHTMSSLQQRGCNRL